MNMEMSKIGRAFFGLSPKLVQEYMMDMDVVYRNDLSKVQLRLAAAEEKIEDYKKQLDQAAEKERYLMQAIMRSEKEGDSIRQKAIEESQEIMNKALNIAESMKDFESDAEKIVHTLKHQVETVNNQFKKHFAELQHLTGTKALPKVELEVDDLIGLPPERPEQESTAHYTRSGDKRRKESFSAPEISNAAKSAPEPKRAENDETLSRSGNIGRRESFNNVNFDDAKFDDVKFDDVKMDFDAAPAPEYSERRRSLREEATKPEDSADYIDFISNINTDDIMDELFNKY